MENRLSSLNQSRQSPVVREELNRDVEAFLARGGKITVIDEPVKSSLKNCNTWMQQQKASILRGAKSGGFSNGADRRRKNG